MRNWSELNHDLLGEIVLKLAAIEDFVYFSVVCRSWNRASSLVKCTWKPTMPYLLLAKNEFQNPKFLRKVYSLSSDRCYKLSLPHTFRFRCWGSAFGWIVIQAGPSCITNPFTNARIRLPFVPTMWCEVTPLDNEDELATFYRQVTTRKLVVIQDVESGNDGGNDGGNGLIVFAMHTNWKRSLAFARPGDLTWTSVVAPRQPFTFRAADVVRRDRLVLILYEDSSVGYVELSDLSKSINLEQSSVQAKEFVPSPSPGDFKPRLSGMHLLEMYLVDSFGSLLMVLRHKSTKWDPNGEVSEDEVYKTVRFEVFGIDFKTKKWDRLKDLGDVALFVGDNQSMSVRASDCRNCKSNCIYFTDDCDELWDLPGYAGGHDMGFYDLEDGKIYQFYKGGNVHSTHCTPFWFVPHF
ncbi:putative F-box protein At5g55150 [Silene latifolia]|uniref:putative F-box protein At5g55150 n=1 Tax=Silene latifolia TaxID=37657 RepID=UPI003D773801